jgi:Arc/MetJ family transcription regulator
MMVYSMCMARTNIDIDEVACSAVMQRYGLKTKREAVNFALRQVGRVATLDEALAMQGTGWEGDLDAMRENEHADWTDRE